MSRPQLWRGQQPTQSYIFGFQKRCGNSLVFLIFDSICDLLAETILLDYIRECLRAEILSLIGVHFRTL